MKHPGAGAQPPAPGNAEYAANAGYAEYGDSLTRARVLYQFMYQEMVMLVTSALPDGRMWYLFVGK